MRERLIGSQAWLEQALPGSEAGGAASVTALLDQAARAARSGRYQGALRLLDRLAKEAPQPDVEELDLRAKIYAQLGHHLDAERCWLKATQIDPTNPYFPRALERLRKTRRGGAGVRRVGAALLGVTALALLIGQGVHQASAIRDLRTQQENLSTTTTRGLADVRGAIAAVSDALDPRTSGVAKEAAMMARLDALDARITQGFTTQRSHMEALVAATQVATSKDHAAQERNRQTLAQIAERLDALQKQLDSQWSRLAGEIEVLGAELRSKPSQGTVVPSDSAPANDNAKAPVTLP